jgi:hypothetical protein
MAFQDDLLFGLALACASSTAPLLIVIFSASISYY